MNDLFLVVYDYPWQVDGTDVWLTKPYKLASSLKDAKRMLVFINVYILITMFEFFQ